jgi:hypothetical protein
VPSGDERAGGAGAGLLVLDAVPAVDVTVRRDEAALGYGDHREDWPAPLVKCSAAESHVRGFASGVRSALLRQRPARDPSRSEAARSDGDGDGGGGGGGGGGRWYRLKGCGNHDQGFPVVPVLDDAGQPMTAKDGTTPLRKIRGACYVHTATLELHMSARVSALLAPVGMRCANAPCGWWEYDLQDRGGGGSGAAGGGAVAAEFGAVVRCCALFEVSEPLCCGGGCAAVNPLCGARDAQGCGHRHPTAATATATPICT